MRAQHLSQRRVQQVSGRVIAPGRIARRRVHDRPDTLSLGEGAACDLDVVATGKTRARTDDPVHPREHDARVALEDADIRDLSACLDVKRRAIQGDISRCAHQELRNLSLLVVEQGHDLRIGEIG
jgi:hypothetical protein